VRNSEMSTTRATKEQRSAGSTRRPVRPRRDFHAMDKRRMRAAELFEQGVIPAECPLTMLRGAVATVQLARSLRWRPR
jgi:hypothetical protein